MKDCLFCQIAEQKIPSKIVHQDDQAVVFEDINPQAPVHLLVIPRKHVASLQELQAADANLFGHLIMTCAKMAKLKGIAEGGYRVVTNQGRDGGQTVFHLHLHLLGGRRMTWPPG